MIVIPGQTLSPKAGLARGGLVSNLLSFYSFSNYSFASSFFVFFFLLFNSCTTITNKNCFVISPNSSCWSFKARLQTFTQSIDFMNQIPFLYFSPLPLLYNNNIKSLKRSPSFCQKNKETFRSCLFLIFELSLLVKKKRKNRDLSLFHWSLSHFLLNESKKKLKGKIGIYKKKKKKKEKKEKQNK